MSGRIKSSLLVLGLAAVLALGAWFKVPATESMEYKLYDWRLQLSPKASLSPDILFVAIDEASLESYGRWPWPRGLVANLIEKVSSGAPKVLGLNIFYVDPDQSSGLVRLDQLQEEYKDLTQGEDRAGVLKAFKGSKKIKGASDFVDDLLAFGESLAGARNELDNDKRLAETVAGTPRLVLPMAFALDKPLAGESPETLKKMEKFALTVEGQAGPGAQEGYQALLPLENLLSGASGLGHSLLLKDSDGSLRADTPWMLYQGRAFPSFSLEMARVALGLKPSQVKVRPGREILLGDKSIPLDSSNRMLIDYHGPYSSLKTISAADVLDDEKIQPQVFKDKIVLIGTRAAGLGTLYVVPGESNFPDNGILVTILQNILSGRFLSRPAWAFWTEWGGFLLVALLCAFLLPYLKIKGGTLVTLLLSLGLAGGGFYLFIREGIWVRIFYSLALLLGAYLVTTVRGFLFTEKRQELAEADSIESNKSLGLSYQTQGMLDMALEKFRKCPVDQSMKEILYNLALDFERKRQFSKASVVYEHIGAADPGYKDIQDRKKSAKLAGETMISGPGLGLAKQEGTLVVEGAAVKPTLGRYEIQRELGRGAMGIVYLGKDPKINRLVAIKTVRFEEDGDQNAAREMKERFFREAESAGALNHPNIIRIFDAGEDNDVSYIAMELLEGEDLKKHASRESLLSPGEVLKYAAIVADALDYAHAKGVVHRDVKPANVMKLKDGTLRVTDFGIARIQASSKTQTGTVMGTPSYMSPEQVAGKKVDGRADLFSLGVMCYELLTGEKPFEGDSMASLLFKIANEPHPDPSGKGHGRVTGTMKKVLDKALAKDPADRYQRGRDMAADLRACLKETEARSPMPEPQYGHDTAELSPEPSSSAASPEPSDTVEIPPPDDTLRMPS